MQNTKFSIITASYNYQDYIKETIESVINQTYQNWELIVVDDGSKDNSIEVINEYCKKDSRIKLYTHENNQNKGLIETIKLGIEKSETEWIAFLESDDIWTQNHLEEKIKVINENPEVKFIFNDVNLFGDEKRIEIFERHFANSRKLIKDNPYPNSQLKCFKGANIVPTFSVVTLKKELLQDIDFNSPIPSIVDYYIWMQIARKTSLFYIDKKLTNWRMHKESYMGRKPRENQARELAFKTKKIIFLYDNKFEIVTRIIREKINYYKRKIIRLHIKDRELFLFGRKFNF